MTSNVWGVEHGVEKALTTTAARAARKIQNPFRVQTKMTINRGAGARGAAFTEVTGRPANRFYRPKQTIRTTTSDPMGGGARSTASTIPGNLTPLGRKTRNYTAGAGAVGGYAALVAHDNKQYKAAKKAGVQKNMSTSAWGIDHGAEISKGATRDFLRAEQAGWKGSKGDNKRRLRNVSRVRSAELAGMLTGAAGGGALGAGIGALTRRPQAAQAGGLLGGVAGGAVYGTHRGNKKFKEVYPGWKRADGGLTGRVKRA